MRGHALTRLLAGIWLACSVPTALSAPPSSGLLEEVIVAARLRNEDLQHTPVSVISLSAGELEAASTTHLRDLQYLVPNLTLSSSQNVGDAAGNAFIRGIGQEDFIAGAEPGVGLYVDGIYLARTGGTLISLLDVERIEVLRGPQGTLYGKNTIGGSVNLISVAPQAEPLWRASMTLGTRGRVEPKLVINAPVTERLRLRAAAMSVDRDGYVARALPPGATPALIAADSRAEGDDHSRAALVQLRWLPTDAMTVDVAADASRRRSQQAAHHLDEVDPQASVIPVVNLLIADGVLPGPRFGLEAAPPDLLLSYAGNESFIRQDSAGVSARLRQTFGNQAFDLIGAHRWFRNHLATDTDGWPLGINRSEFKEDQRQSSAEARWSGQSGRTAWTAGLFALREPILTLPTSAGIGVGEVLYTCGCYFTSFPGATSVRRHLVSRSKAIYGQLTLPVAGPLTATLGVRRSHEAKSIDATLLALDGSLRPSAEVLAYGSNRDHWNSNTTRAGLEWQAAPELMVYGSVAQGFKSGGFNVRPSRILPNLGLAQFAPEKALTVEAGLRSEWWRQRMRLNVTLFHTGYRDIQLRQQTLVSGQTVTLIGNAARARIRGLEAEWSFVPIPEFTFSASYGHLDGRYLDIGRAPEITLESRFQRTPRHSASVAADFRRPLARGVVELHANYGFRSREQFQLSASPYDQGAYGLLGARISFSSRSDRWSMSIFGTNLTDVRYRTAGRYPGIHQFGVAHSIIGLPRQLGVQLEVKR